MNQTISNKTVEEAKAGSDAAANEIFNTVRPMLGKLANRIGGQYEVEEVMSVGREAVWEAVLSFDSSKASFITHAYAAARVAMLRFISANNPGPSVPWRTVQRYQHVMELADGDVGKALLLMDESDDSTELGSVDTFLAVHAALSDTHHTDFQVRGSDDDGEPTERELADPVDVEETALNRVVVDALFGECTEREVLILSMTYGIGGHPEMKDQDIADAVGISRPRVVTIRKAAQERLAAANTELAGVI